MASNNLTWLHRLACCLVCVHARTCVCMLVGVCSRVCVFRQSSLGFFIEERQPYVHEHNARVCVCAILIVMSVMHAFNNNYICMRMPHAYKLLKWFWTFNCYFARSTCLFEWSVWNICHKLDVLTWVPPFCTYELFVYYFCGQAHGLCNKDAQYSLRQKFKFVDAEFVLNLVEPTFSSNWFQG